VSTNAAAQSTASVLVTPNIAISAEGMASAVIDGERKTVTALFADIKGSTNWCVTSTPRRLAQLLTPYCGS
jgi:class 3 adenylate cyclase